MDRKDLAYVKIEDLKPYENNPRKNDKAVDAVAESIKNFGFKVPIIVDKDNVIVAGHTRYKASKKLGLEEVPVIVADDLTKEQIKAFRLADNKVSELAEWDFDKLDEELANIEMEIAIFGFEMPKGTGENPYTKKVDIPKYEPTEEEPPEITELVDLEKVAELNKEIEKSDIPDEVKEFLKLASYRHAVFDYGKIAEYYCHASKEVQDLMEKSALVIIDYKKAIEYGYTNLNLELEEMMEQDKNA